MTEKQESKIQTLCARYCVARDTADVMLNPWDLPKGWVSVVIAGVYFGIDPEGYANS